MKKLPALLFGEEAGELNIFNYDVKTLMNNSKVVLDQFAMSFLLQGCKQVNFAGSSVQVDNTKILIIAEGNCLVTEKGQGSDDFKSIMLFFSKKKLTDLLLKKGLRVKPLPADASAPNYFVAEQDEFVKIYISALSLYFTNIDKPLAGQLLELKFEEIMIYLINKYGDAFINFLLCPLKNNRLLSFKNIIETNKYNSLGVGELAFLCNMSVSTFKRHFAEEFSDTPGNWFKRQRLEKAKHMLQSGEAKPSEVFSISGYKNLSHFSSAYKARFGKTPRLSRQS